MTRLRLRALPSFALSLALHAGALAFCVLLARPFIAPTSPPPQSHGDIFPSNPTLIASAPDDPSSFPVSPRGAAERSPPNDQPFALPEIDPNPAPAHGSFAADLRRLVDDGGGGDGLIGIGPASDVSPFGGGPGPRALHTGRSFGEAGGAGGGEGSGGTGDSAASVAVGAVDYPLAARRRGEQGTVILGVRILADGRLGDVTIVSSSGSACLDQTALAAVRKAPLRPQLVDGSPRDSLTQLRFCFLLVSPGGG